MTIAVAHFTQYRDCSYRLLESVCIAAAFFESAARMLCWHPAQFYGETFLSRVLPDLFPAVLDFSFLSYPGGLLYNICNFTSSLEQSVLLANHTWLQSDPPPKHYNDRMSQYAFSEQEHEMCYATKKAQIMDIIQQSTETIDTMSVDIA